MSLIAIVFAAVMVLATASYPDITVTYFDFPGRAEPARLALYIAGIPFIDQRLKSEEWVAVKPTTPFGQLPLMTIDGELYSQSKAILRYAGCLGGLYPTDPLQALSVDMALDKLLDIVDTLRPSMSENDPATKLALRRALVDDVLPEHLHQLDLFICKRNPNYAVGDSLTIADLTIFNFVNWLGTLDGIPTDFNQFMNISKVYDSVSTHPRVQDWYNKNPSQNWFKNNNSAIVA